MPDLGNHYTVGDTLLIPFQTLDSANAAIDADSVPTYRIYERGGTTAVATGSSAKRDDANTTGYYEAEVTLSSGSGFEQGKFYVVRKEATIGGESVISYDTFYISGGITSFAAIAGWPTLADVEARFDDLGLTPPADATTNAVIAACVTAWEQRTGYDPFLSVDGDTTWYFQPKDVNLVDFGQDGGPGGFVSITSVTVGVTYANATGVALVSGRDYQLKPANAAARNRPYTYLTMQRVEYDAGEASIKVIGQAGFAETVPADVWEAVMRCILAMLLPAAGVALSGGLSEWKEADVSERYGAEGPVYSAIGYFERFEQLTLSTYRRLKVV